MKKLTKNLTPLVIHGISGHMTTRHKDIFQQIKKELEIFVAGRSKILDV